jgi:hypothetical protein
MYRIETISKWSCAFQYGLRFTYGTNLIYDVDTSFQKTVGSLGALCKVWILTVLCFLHTAAENVKWHAATMGGCGLKKWL